MKKIITFIVVITLIILILYLGYIFINKNSKDGTSVNNIVTSSIDNFYSYELTKTHKDIRTLPKDYSKEDAQLDNCFVISTTKNNNYLYSQFTSDYRNWSSSFIRVVKTTNNDGLIINDILYDSDLGKILIISDTTRDYSVSQEAQNISFKEFEQTGEYKYEDSSYWIAFNGNLTSDIFENDNVFIIAKIR